MVLDLVGVVALFHERQCKPAGAASRGYERAFVELRLGPLGVQRLEVDWETSHVAAVDRWKVASHRDHGRVRVATRKVELLESFECPHDRTTRPVTLAEPERRRGIGDLQFDTRGVLVELRC